MSLYNNVLHELQYYILNDENIQKSLRMKINNNDKEKNDKQNNKNEHDNKSNAKKVCCIKKPDIIVPNEQDTLFWCFYIIKNGETNYELLNNKNSLLAKQQKIELITNTIRKNKTILKMYKFDTLSNYENNLANDYSLNIQTFLILCAIENINIIYVNNKTYFELMMNDSNNIYIGSEGMGKGGEKIINYLLKLAFPNKNIIWENTNNSNIIVKSNFIHLE